MLTLENKPWEYPKMAEKTAGLMPLIEEVRKMAKATSLQKMVAGEGEITSVVTKEYEPPSLAKQASGEEEQPLSKEKLIELVSTALRALKEKADKLNEIMEELREVWTAALESEAGIEAELNDLVGEGWFANTAAKLTGAIEEVSQTGEELGENLTKLGELLWEELRELEEIVREIPPERK